MSEDAIVLSRNMLALLAFLLGFGFPVAGAADARVSEAYGRLPLHFEANRGQTHEDVRFLARGPGYSLYLTDGEAVLVLARPNADAKRDARSGPQRLSTAPCAVLDATLGGGQDAFVTKLDPTGSTLFYSTYLGGSRSEFGFGIAMGCLLKTPSLAAQVIP